MDHPRLLEAGRLLDVECVIKFVPVNAQAQLELLYFAVEPFSEFQLGHILFTGPAEQPIAGAKVPYQAHCIKHRAFTRPIRPAQYAERIKLCLEGYKATEIIHVESRDHANIIF
jgi:hypothetical protein